MRRGICFLGLARTWGPTTRSLAATERRWLAGAKGGMFIAVNRTGRSYSVGPRGSGIRTPVVLIRLVGCSPLITTRIVVPRVDFCILFRTGITVIGFEMDVRGHIPLRVGTAKFREHCRWFRGQGKPPRGLSVTSLTAFPPNIVVHYWWGVGAITVSTSLY